MANKHDDQVRELNQQFSVMVAHASKSRRLMQEDLQLYFSDVEDTGTTMTREQLDFIEEQYDIPISTKLAWAIIQQMTAFLTGGKPAPRLIAATNGQIEFATMYAQAVTALWYETHMNREMAKCVEEALVSGLGWIHTRPNDFYSESTFGVVNEYVPNYKVLVDPHSEKPDFSDAEYMVKADIMPKTKAEKRYDIKITEDHPSDLYTPDSLYSMDINTVATSMGWPYATPDGSDKNRYVWVREFFSKQQANVYIGDGGQVSSKRPKPVEIPNEEKNALARQIEELRMQHQEGLQQAQQAQASQGQAIEELSNPNVPYSEAAMVNGATQRSWDEISAQMDTMTQQLSEMEQQYAQMPEFVTAYDMTLLSGEEITVASYSRKSDKFIKRWLLVGNQIVEQGLIPCDEYPLTSFSFCQANRPDKVYGIMHFIKDMIKAMDKFWSLMIYDMQTSVYKKVFYYAGTVTNPAQAEKDFSYPMSWIEIKPNEALPNGGMPVITDSSGLNPALEKIIQLLQGLIEYVTGMSALVQGQPSAATPDTFGGIQTMQSFGTERVKLYSRWLEDAMERMTYVTTCYLQAYAPKDKALTYLDENGDQSEIILLEAQEDFRFKVRMNMTAALPTARHMAAQILGTLSGQTADPNIQSLLTQYAIEYMDIPESQKLREEIDLVKQLSSQLEQAQKSNADLETKNAQLEQQNFQKDLKDEYVKGKADLDAQKQIAESEIAQSGAPTEEPPPFESVNTAPPEPEEPPF